MWIAYDPICAKRPSSFLQLDFKSNYLPGFDPSDELLYQITVPISTEEKSISDDTCPWSD